MGKVTPKKPLEKNQEVNSDELEDDFDDEFSNTTENTDTPEVDLVDTIENTDTPEVDLVDKIKEKPKTPKPLDLVKKPKKEEEEVVTIKKSEFNDIKDFMKSQGEENKKLRGLIDIAGNANRIKAAERKNFKPEKMKFSLSLYKENEENIKVVTRWKMIDNNVHTDNQSGREIVNQNYKVYFSNEEKDCKIISLDAFRERIIKTPKLEASRVYTPDNFEIRPTIDDMGRVYFKPPKVYSEKVDEKTGRPLGSWRESFFADISYEGKKYQIENLYLN